MTIEYKNFAKNIITTEIEALAYLSEQIDDSFNRALEIMSECKGKIVLLGVGKSGIIARKIASTLNSLSQPSLFMHPTEAMHGDLGAIIDDDVILAISYSGESIELLSVVTILRERSNKVISMTSDENSTLAQMSDMHLCTKVTKEACINNLAPTCSTVVQLAMGDALAVSLSHKRNLTRQHFADNHPGGTLCK